MINNYSIENKHIVEKAYRAKSKEEAVAILTEKFPEYANTLFMDDSKSYYTDRIYKWLLSYEEIMLANYSTLDSPSRDYLLLKTTEKELKKTNNWLKFFGILTILYVIISILLFFDQLLS